MVFSRSDHSSSNVPQPFAGGDVRQFEVYTDRNERVGTVVDLLRDEAHQPRFLIVNLDAWAGNKQIVLPLNYVAVDPRSRQVRIANLSKTQIAELPIYPAANAYPAATYPRGAATERMQRQVLDDIPLEASAPLEGSLPLDYEISPTIVRSAPPPVPVAEATPPLSTPIPPLSPIEAAIPSHEGIGQPLNPTISNREPIAPKVVEAETVRLLEERLVVDRKRRKVGEVIVRKEIETYMIEVPVRREKLIVEQVSPEHRPLASFALGQPELEGVELTGGSETARTISGEFTSAQAASQFLDAIANRPEAGYRSIQVKVVLEKGEPQEVYQQWLDHYSAQNRIQFES